MMHEYNCKTCNGTGKEEVEEETLEFIAPPAVEEPVVKASTKPKPKTIAVEPIMKAASTKKK